MPDGPRYDEDFYAWTQYQADVVRTPQTRDNRFDRENLAEEIGDLGNSERDAIRSQVRRILVHFLKPANSPAGNPRFGWMSSIVDARVQLEDKLTPSLRRDIEEVFVRLYAAATTQSALELQAALPPARPYTIDQNLAEDWYPEPVGNPEENAK